MREVDKSKLPRARARSVPPNKTAPTRASVSAHLDAIPNAERRADARRVARMMQEITGEKPVMWGPSIVGYGSYHYRYESGREGDMPRAGFAARKTGLVVYVLPGFERYEPLLARLGKHTTGVSCLYIQRLADVDEGVLREIVREALAWVDQEYPRRTQAKRARKRAGKPSARKRTKRPAAE